MIIVALRIYFGFGNGLLEGELEVTCTLKPCCMSLDSISIERVVMKLDINPLE